MISKSSKNFPLRWYDNFLLKLIPPAASVVVRLLLGSCRVVRIVGKEKAVKYICHSQGRAIYATWHQRMIFHARHIARDHITIMISQSRDGEYGARLAKLLGFKDVRGSSTRGGLKVIRELVKKVQGGERAGILADGPLGPARVAKMGPTIIARDSNAPLVPIVWGCDRGWVLNSWDRYLIPKPFARIAICYAEPLLVPKEIRGRQLEPYRALLEQRLNQATQWCDDYFGIKRPWRRVKRDEPEFGPINTIDTTHIGSMS